MSLIKLQKILASTKATDYICALIIVVVTKYLLWDQHHDNINLQYSLQTDVFNH